MFITVAFINMTSPNPMHTFFHGWRRKAGCLTLGIAMFVAAAWLRSRNAHDSVLFGFNGRQHTVYSFDGRVTWLSFDPPSGRSPSHAISGMLVDGAQFQEIAESIERARSNLADIYDLTEWFIPYEMIVIPLTILSAYLLLWKPRRRACPS